MSPATLWRAARPVLLLLAAVALAALVVATDLRVRTIAVAGIVALALALSWSVLTLYGGRKRPVLLVYLFEFEVVLMVVAILYVLTAVIAVMTEVTARYQGKATAYLVGLVAGAAVGLFGKDLLTSSKDEAWLPVHCRFRMNRRFEPLFYRYDDDSAAWDTTQPRRWSPEGLMSEALAANAYVRPTVGWIDGWDHDARLERARTLAAGLTAPPEPTPA